MLHFVERFFFSFWGGFSQTAHDSSTANRHTSLFMGRRCAFHFSGFLTTRAQEDFTLQGFELWHGFHSSMMLPDKILLFLIHAQETSSLQGFSFRHDFARTDKDRAGRFSLTRSFNFWLRSLCLRGGQRTPSDVASILRTTSADLD